MSNLTPARLLSLAEVGQNTPPFNLASSLEPRAISIWEITQWILPMAPEHFRRVLAATPDLPQGSVAVEGGTRWFSPADLVALRRHFARPEPRARHLPARPAGARAPFVVLAQPQGRMGRSFAALHLATAAALAGWRVLLIDADPAGKAGPALGVPGLPSDLGPSDLGVAGLVARAAARHLRRLNAARLERGETPLPMDDTLDAAMTLRAADLIRPSRWPGLDVLAATPALFRADMQIGNWRMDLRNWQPWQALAGALDEDGLRQDYDLILCDPAAGLGPLALSMLMSADVLLAPLPLRGPAYGPWFQGLAALAAGTARLHGEAQALARALGQAGAALPWRRLAILPTRGGMAAAGLPPGLDGQDAGISLLPDALPELSLGAQAQFYDLDYRDIGKLAYSPQRDAAEAAWRGVAHLITGLWAEDQVGG